MKKLFTTINEFKQYLEYFEDQTGILIYPHSQVDAYEIGQVLDNSDYYVEWDARDGYFFLEESDIDSFDIIIGDLEELLDKYQLHYRIKTRTEINEELENSDINSDKSIGLENYEKSVAEFNQNKNKLDRVLSFDKEDWEDKAHEIINGNKYLGLYWKYIKSVEESDEMEERLKSSELTNDEKTEMKNKLSELQKTMIDNKRQIDQSIKDDLDNIKKQ